MTTATRAEKAYFLLIFLSAIWIGVVGFFLPALLDTLFTWMDLPPLHARFLGSIYLFGAAVMLSSALAANWMLVTDSLIAAAIWTGLMFVVSVLQFPAFDLEQFGPWAWLITYLSYPVLALVLAWLRSRNPQPASASPDGALPGWVRTSLMTLGAIFVVLGLALLLVPDVAPSYWPWNVTPSLAQFYSGPLLAFGYYGVQFARKGTIADLRVLVPSMLVFTVFALAGSLLHLGLFSFGELNDLLWFAVFIVGTGFLAYSTYLLLNNGTREIAPSRAS